MIILLLITAFCLITSPVIASDTKDVPWPKEMVFIHPTPPVFKYDLDQIMANVKTQASSKEIKKQENPVSIIDTESVLNFIKSNRNALCAANPNGSFEFWISLEAGGKVLGFGIDGKSGLKATFNCPKQK